jgi:hypothetical protein
MPVLASAGKDKQFGLLPLSNIDGPRMVMDNTSGAQDNIYSYRLR